MSLQTLPDYLQEYLQNKNLELESNRDFRINKETYLEVRNRIDSINIQSDNENEWWSPNEEQLMAINIFIMKELAPELNSCHSTHYTIKEFGPYKCNGKEYKIYYPVGWPNFNLQLQGGKKRQVVLNILPTHSGAKF